MYVLVSNHKVYFCIYFNASVITRILMYILDNIWKLARLGHNEKQLEEGISLLIGVPWRILAVEQGHDLADKIKKMHKEHKSSTRTARAMVASMQPLVSRSAEKKVDRESVCKASTVVAKAASKTHRSPALPSGFAGHRHCDAEVGQESP